jgi:hypothetical protein
VTFSAVEKLAAIEHQLECDAANLECKPYQRAIFEAIAADYRAKAQADALAEAILEEGSKVIGYLQWKDAQDAVQHEAD